MSSFERPRGLSHMDGGAQLRRWRMKADLHPGVESADAYLVAWGGTGNPVGNLGDVNNVVHPIFDPHRKKIILIDTVVWTKRCSDARGRYEIVSVDGGNWHLGKMDAELAVNSSALASVWRTTAGGVESDSGLNQLVYHWSGAAIPSTNKVVMFLHQTGIWYALPVTDASLPLFKFYLNENLVKGESASASIEGWDGDSWEVAAGDPVTVWDSSSLGPAAGPPADSQKHSGWAYLSPDSGRYEIITLETDGPIIPFALYGDIDRGGTAEAKLRVWDTDHWEASGDPFDVYDSSSLGPAKAASDENIMSGWCQYRLESGRYEIIALNGMRGLLGKTAETISADAVGTVDIYAGHAGAEASVGWSVEASNKFMESGSIASGKWVWVAYNDASDSADEDDVKWYIISARCPTS